jgi:hypothetical protein
MKVEILSNGGPLTTVKVHTKPWPTTRIFEGRHWTKEKILANLQHEFPGAAE